MRYLFWIENWNKHLEEDTFILVAVYFHSLLILNWGRRGRDLMAVRFATTYAISAYHH